MKENPWIRHVIINAFETEYTQKFQPYETLSQTTRITDYNEAETDDDKQILFNTATANFSTVFSKLLFFIGFPSQLRKRADLQPFLDYFCSSIKNMTGYITQEKYTAGKYLEHGYRNLSYLGDVPSTLTSLLKCIFFDSRVEYQAHRDRNIRVVKLKTCVSTALDERATETASIDIDNGNLLSKEMAELINERAQIKIDKVTKQFANKIKQMENMMKQQKSSAKNGRRENANSRANQMSNNNNNNNNTGGQSTRQKKNKKQQSQKAEDAVNTSGKGKKKKNNKNSNGKGSKNKRKENYWLVL